MANEGQQLFHQHQRQLHENPAINGTEATFTGSTEGQLLAEQVLDGVVETVEPGTTACARTPPVRAAQDRMPAILVELAYLSNPADAEKLRNDQYQFARASMSASSGTSDLPDGWAASDRAGRAAARSNPPQLSFLLKGIRKASCTSTGRFFCFVLPKAYKKGISWKCLISRPDYGISSGRKGR